MNLSDLETRLYEELGYASSPAAAVTTRLRGLINRVHRELLTTPGISRLRSEPSVSFASGTSRVATIPSAIEKIISLYDQTNDRYLDQQDPQVFRLWDPGDDSSGNPWAFGVLTRNRAVSTQPSNASAIFVDSTAGGDTGTAFIEGITDDGDYLTDSVTMTGTTGVQIGSRTDWLYLTKFYLSAAAVGVVTLHEDSEGGTTLATLQIGMTYHRRGLVAFHPVPSSSLTLRADIVHSLEDMANANDEPLIPEDFHDLLHLGVLKHEYRIRQQRDLAVGAARDFTERRDALIFWLAEQMPVQRRTGRAEHSQLGSTYPAGT